MTPELTRQALLDQHARIRDQVRRCLDLAYEYRQGTATAQAVSGRELDVALEVLRQELALHNEAESSIVVELLQGPSPWSKQMIDRMLEEHLAEHAAFWNLLVGSRDELLVRIHELAEELDAHMAAEERTFLAPATLREDVIRSRSHR